MRICVAHETVFRYDAPCMGVIQTLRLTPRNHAGQYVVSWRMDLSANCRLEPVEDAFGNILHTFSLAGPVTELRIVVDGEVETQDTAGIVKGAVERFPPSLFMRETALTRADAALLTYAAQFPRPTAAGTLDILHKLLARIHHDFHRDLQHDLPADAGAAPASADAPPPSAEAAVSAAEAFKSGGGAAQDLAHIFIAVARALGVPARYVSGYVRHNASADASSASQTGVCSGGRGQAHVQTQGAVQASGQAGGKVGDAWAEVYVAGLGWVGFDPANGICSTEQHVRVAIGLDCLGAAPVRGAHYGGVREDVAVRLAVTQAAWQTQG
jgi:transglutaminase-like putative cysteine protease